MEKYNLKFIAELQAIADEITYHNDDSISLITENDLEVFLKTFEGSRKRTLSYGISYLKSRMTNDYESLKELVELRQKDILEKQKQNESILKITDALNSVGTMLDQTTINSFSLSDYRQSLDALIEKLENDYCVSVEDEDLTKPLTQAGKEMFNFLDALESEIKDEILMPPKEEIAELVKKIFLDYDLATYLIFEARKFERTRNY
jgi:hypothetical protein